MDEAPLLTADRRTGDLLGIGQISLDRVLRVDGLPGPGEKRRVLSERTLPGGQIATALLAAARLGAPCRFVGAIGADEAGERALAPLVDAGIGLAHLTRIDGLASRSALVLVDEHSGERSILERRPPALELPLPPLPSQQLTRAGLLLLDLEHPQAAGWAQTEARAAGVPSLVDADQVSDAAIALLRSAGFPTVSESFARELHGDDPVRTLRALAGPETRLAVVTRGARGSVALSGDLVIETPAPAVRVVDTTGAGDVFRGALAWALLAGRGPQAALTFANAAAALSCRGAGAQGALPTHGEIESRLGRAAAEVT
jgi:sugar/nucleoside kinase (ribokinase family)